MQLFFYIFGEDVQSGPFAGEHLAPKEGGVIMSCLSGVDAREAGQPVSLSQLLFVTGRTTGNIRDLGNSFYRESQGDCLRIGIANRVFGNRPFDDPVDENERLK